VRRHPRRPVPLLLVLLVLLAALALATGCERRSQEAPAADAPAAALVVTADYGAQALLEARVEPGQSLMRALRGATEVDTAYGGAFVQAMLGRSGDASAMRDWFFYVNGVVGVVSAQDVELADGDAAWWDYRDWGALMQAPAVVGQWPAPFAHPPGEAPAVAADPPLRAALADAGAQVTERDSPWRVRVGASDELARRDPAWRRALDDPNRAGLTITVDGGRIVALSADASGREPVPGARALAAAVPTGAQPADGVLMAVAGLDAASAQAAAERIAADPSLLGLRYAVAFDGDGTPLRAGGRAGP